MSPPEAEFYFMTFGVQYYTVARFSALSQLSHVCGNLYHHAIEMLLKARLSQTYTLKELSHRRLGHNLRTLWRAFKGKFPTENLDQFDDIVATLHRFERIRYPDTIINEGAAIMIAWEQRQRPGLPTSWPGNKPMPIYENVVPSIDHLVSRIFDICSWDTGFLLLTAGMNDYVLEVITRDNPASGGWFPPQ